MPVSCVLTCRPLTATAGQASSSGSGICADLCSLPELALIQVQSLPEPQLDPQTVDAFTTAYNNIRAFHEAQQSDGISVETMSGVTCRRIARPIGAALEAALLVACHVAFLACTASHLELSARHTAPLSRRCGVVHCRLQSPQPLCCLQVRSACMCLAALRCCPPALSC